MVTCYGVFTPYTDEGNCLMVWLDEALSIQGWSNLQGSVGVGLKR